MAGGAFAEVWRRAFLVGLRGSNVQTTGSANVFGGGPEAPHARFAEARSRARGFVLAGAAYDGGLRFDAYLVQANTAGKTGCQQSEAVTTLPLDPPFVDGVSQQAVPAKVYRADAKSERFRDGRTICPPH